MQENPIRKCLVTRIKDWLYKGRGHDIRWSQPGGVRLRRTLTRAQRGERSCERELLVVPWFFCCLFFVLFVVWL